MITRSDRDITVVYRILKYCSDIDKATAHFGNSFEDFKSDVVFRNAISMPIFQIGELTNHLSEEFKSSHTNIPWAIIRGMRNWFAHNYYKMDLDKIWEAVVEDVPKLRKFCEDVLAQLKNAK